MPRSHTFATLLPALGAMLVACGHTPTATPLERLPTGSWGGEHIGVFVDSTGVTFMFDCAGGRVDGSVPLATDGSFDVAGVFTGGGNALGADHTPHPARYTGHATTTRIDVTRTLLDGSTAPTTFTAARGAAPQVIAC
jgi:hypothetical protein